MLVDWLGNLKIILLLRRLMMMNLLLAVLKLLN